MAAGWGCGGEAVGGAAVWVMVGEVELWEGTPLICAGAPGADMVGWPGVTGGDVAFGVELKTERWPMGWKSSS